jgi:hypothetical protein
MKTATHSMLFIPGGCLTAQAFRGHLSGSLSAAEQIRVKEHLRSCRICSEALEGYKRHRNHDYLQGDIEMLSTRIRKRYASRHNNKPTFPIMIVVVLIIFFIIVLIAYYIIRFLLVNP